MQLHNTLLNCSNITTKKQQLEGVKEVGGCAKSQEYLLMCAITSQFSICVRWLSVDVSYIYIYTHTQACFLLVHILAQSNSIIVQLSKQKVCTHIKH